MFHQTKKFDKFISELFFKSKFIRNNKNCFLTDTELASGQLSSGETTITLTVFIACLG